MKKRMLCALLAAVLCACVLPGCERQPEPTEFTTFAMDTVMNVTLYGEEESIGVSQAQIPTQLALLEDRLSVTKKISDLYQVNRAKGQPVELRDHTAQWLCQALELCELTGGALDITAYPAVKAWGFTTGENRVPDPEELAALAGNIDYTAVRIEGNRITLPAGMELDMGAVAKGLAGDSLAQILRDNGIFSGLLDLGQSTIVAIGTKPGGSPWRIGVRDPDGESYFGIVELADMSMGTSGGYQRYFELGGVTYWHILDPKTAAPARSGLTSVTVVSPSALVCDGLSTALFVMGLEDGAQFWRNHPELEFEAVFVTEDGGIYCTAGLENRFSLAKGYEKREVTLLQ